MASGSTADTGSPGVPTNDVFTVQGTTNGTPIPVTLSGSGPGGGLTDEQLRATPVPVAVDSAVVSGTVAVSNLPAAPLTDTQLRAVAVPVSGAVSVSNFPATQPVSGTVTANIGSVATLALDATLTGGTQKSKLVDTGGTNVASVSAAGALKVDGSAVTQPVSGTVTATGPLTDTQLRATPVPVSGTVAVSSATVSGSVSVSNFPATQPVSGTVTATGPLTDTQLRATAVPVTNYAPLTAAIDGVATLTSAGDNVLIASQGGSVRIYVTSLSCSNTSSTGVRIDFKDGVTVKHSFFLAPSGGGASHIFPFPWRLTAATALQVAISGSVTDVRVSATGFAV